MIPSKEMERHKDSKKLCNSSESQRTEVERGLREHLVRPRPVAAMQTVRQLHTCPPGMPLGTHPSGQGSQWP